jgi:hypothetical protein
MSQEPRNSCEARPRAGGWQAAPRRGPPVGWIAHSALRGVGIALGRTVSRCRGRLDRCGPFETRSGWSYRGFGSRGDMHVAAFSMFVPIVWQLRAGMKPNKLSCSGSPWSGGRGIAAVTVVRIVHKTIGSAHRCVSPAGWAAVIVGSSLVGRAGTPLPVPRVPRTSPTETIGSEE